jgi:ribose/xylose/arabinose/galactoside ABC-type transport system permease subunit
VLSSRTLVAPLCLAVAVVAFAFAVPSSLSGQNYMNVMGQAAPLAIVALGQMVVIITRNFDISVGSVAALAALVTVVVVNALGPIGLLAGPLVGIACGLVNGVVVGRLRVQPVIATLGMLSFARGLALVVGDGQAVTFEGDNPIAWLGYDKLAGVSIAFLAVLAFAALLAVALRRTRGGRRLYMVGSDPDAAALVGVDRARVVLIAFAITGLTAGLASLLLVARAGAGLPTEGAGLELSAIAAAVIGGAALSGGVGRPVFVLVGAVFIQSLGNGLNLVGTSPFLQEIILGAVILLAGLIDWAIRRVAVHRRWSTTWCLVTS